jgi:hypothetical protein
VLTDEQQKLADLLQRNFSEHRISLQRPMDYADPEVKIADGRVSVDFTRFDQSLARWLPEMTAFSLPRAFMAVVGEIKPGDPRYDGTMVEILKIVAAHLRAKGWLEKGYNYIFDEPKEKHFAGIVEEARLWREADPELKILLTKEPEKPLFGSVDIWCPVIDAYNTRACHDRQARGETVWWYVCNVPIHPYPNYFIDYPALDARVLHWMSWKYGVTGLLYWSVTWQSDPYNHPMDVSDDGKRTYPNGDGNLLYPATGGVSSEEPIIAPPFDSIRWEMIREGMEDYDYFWMLSDSIKRAEASGGKAREVKAGKAALAGVSSLVCSTVDYEKDPSRYYGVRRKVAEALEQLQADGSVNATQ